MHSRIRFSTTSRLSPAAQSGPFAHAQKYRLPPESPVATTSIAIGSFDLVRKFVEHLVVKNAAEGPETDGSRPYEIDWAEVEASTSDCQTLEQAIGRAVVVADRMSRGASSRAQSANSSAYDAKRPLLCLQRGRRRTRFRGRQSLPKEGGQKARKDPRKPEPGGRVNLTGFPRIHSAASGQDSRSEMKDLTFHRVGSSPSLPIP